MNISLLFQNRLHSALHALARRIAPPALTTVSAEASGSTRAQPQVPRPVPACLRRPGNGSTFPGRINKPLRVVRVLESDQARSSVGRMVISGRMADVCAELDRLVAHEAAFH